MAAAKAGKKEGYVEIELFKDNGKYSDDVFVCVNGMGYQIQRGVRVEVPEVVAEIIEQSMKQDMETARYSEQLANSFSAQIKRL